MLADCEQLIAVCQCNFKIDTADFQDASSVPALPAELQAK
jgi:hypothetical protein